MMGHFITLQILNGGTPYLLIKPKLLNALPPYKTSMDGCITSLSNIIGKTPYLPIKPKCWDILSPQET